VLLIILQTLTVSLFSNHDVLKSDGRVTSQVQSDTPTYFPSYPNPEDLPMFFRDYKNIDLEALILDWSNFFAAADVN
jgi:hypothetical protein